MQMRIKTNERTANGSKRIFWRFRRNYLFCFFHLQKTKEFAVQGLQVWTPDSKYLASHFEIQKNCHSTRCLLLSFIECQDDDASLTAMAISFLILVVLISSEMMIPLATINFTDAVVIQELERMRWSWNWKTFFWNSSSTRWLCPCWMESQHTVHIKSLRVPRWSMYIWPVWGIGTETSCT